jgi:hypothetical protein
MCSGFLLLLNYAKSLLDFDGLGRRCRRCRITLREIEFDQVVFIQINGYPATSHELAEQ